MQFFNYNQSFAIFYKERLEIKNHLIFKIKPFLFLDLTLKIEEIIFSKISSLQIK
jgi:hypothetical protein